MTKQSKFTPMRQPTTIADKGLRMPSLCREDTDLQPIEFPWSQRPKQDSEDTAEHGDHRRN